MVWDMTTATPTAPTRFEPAAPRDTITDDELRRILWDRMFGVTVVLLGGANSTMQLAWLPIGRGVAESKVRSGRADLHPVKRTRTTLSYLVIALFGTDEERRKYRSEANTSHRQVRSGPDSEVQYNAFDGELQTWVAACLYVGYEYAYRLTAPELIERYPDEFYRYCRHLGTTLQMREDAWPADRAAFAEYWQEGLKRIEMDDVTRRYLREQATFAYIKPPMRYLVGPLNQFITTGFLPKPFREELGLPWGPRRAAAHKRFVRATIAVAGVLPGPLRRFPMNAYLADTRRRMRTGKAIV